jgi:tetratricopeptide (TPR) repeat protein
MAKKRLNKKVALIGFIFFMFAGIAAIGLFFHLSKNPQKFLKDGDAAIALARQATDKEQRKMLYKEAEQKYLKAYGRSKTDELKVEAIYRITNVSLETGEWRDALGYWAKIVRLDPKDIKARYNRLQYLYIIAQTTSGQIWQEIATQSSEFIDIIEKPGASPELPATDISKLEVEGLKQSGEPDHKLGPYLHLIRGRANLVVAQLGLVTNREETVKQAVSDLEKFKQLEPSNPDIYMYLAQAAIVKSNLEASNGDMDAKGRGQNEAIKILQEGLAATNNGEKANINLLAVKHSFSFAQTSNNPLDQKKQILSMESEYQALAAKFSSNAETLAALSNFYSDFRLGPTYLDKSIETMEKAIALDKNNVDYAIGAANLYSRRYNIRNQPADLSKIIDITKNALLLPDSQDTTGPKSQAVKTNQLMLHTILAYSYLDQILDAEKPQALPDAQKLLSDSRQEIRQIEQLYGSGDDPQVIKWQAMVEFATAKVDNSDPGPAIQKMYKIYTQLKASARSDSRLSYRLAKIFTYSRESGSVGEFLADAMTNGIETIHPEARLDYAELILKVAMWKASLDHLDLFDDRCGVTDRSRILRIRANIGARNFEEAEKYLEQVPQDEPARKMIKMAILEGKLAQLRATVSRREEQQQTSVVVMNIISKREPTEAVDQRSIEQLTTEMKNALSMLADYIDKLSPEDLNSVDTGVVSSMCEAAIFSGQHEQAKTILGKIMKLQPDNSTAIYYTKMLAEPDPAKVSTERNRQIKEEVFAGIADPAKRAIALGLFYQSNGDPNKAEVQFKKLIPPPVGTGEFKAEDTIRRQIGGYLFDIALEKKNWETVDKLVQMAKQDNFDDCSGDFFAARAAFAREQYQTALASIDSALAQRPVFGYGYLMRSRINAALGNEAAALTDMRTAASTNPLDRYIAKELVNRLYTRNVNLAKSVSSAQQAETKSALDWAMALNPGDIQLTSFYAEYISDTDPNRALALRQSLQENMPSVQNAVLLARLATKLGLDSTDPARRQTFLKMAENALNQAKAIDPQNPAVIEYAAKYYRDIGDTNKAESLVKGSNDPKLIWRHYITTGQYDMARVSLEGAYKANPKDEIVLQGLLFLAEKTGNKDSAIKYGEQLLSVAETSDNHLLVIQTFLNVGLTKEAEQKQASFREKYPQDGRGLMLGAWLSMKQGHLKESLELINKRLETDKSDAMAWRLRGQINGALTDYDQAIMDLKQSKVLSDEAATRILLAKIYMKTKRNEEAIIELKSIFDDPQTPDEARTMLEQIYSDTGRKEMLDDLYTKILNRMPDSIYWHKRSAGFAGAMGDYAKAEQLYYAALQKSIDQGQEDSDALGGYLRALLTAGKMDKLFEEGGKYIDGNLAPIAYLRMAEGKMKLGDRITAIEYCKKSVDRAGDNDMMAAKMLERTYALLGEQETEQLCLQKLALNPDSQTANWAMYNLYRTKGDYNKALEYLDKTYKNVNESQPQWVGYLGNKAELLVTIFSKTSDKKYLKDAMDVYESLLKKTPNNTGILNNVAYILADNDQDLDKALEYIKRACEVQPDDPGYLDTYAIVLYKQGKYSEALPKEQAAIRYYVSQGNGVPGEAYENIGKIYEKLGENAKARAAYEQALETGGKEIQSTVKERLNTAIERLGKK